MAPIPPDSPSDMFLAAFNDLILVEGGYANLKNDSGGKTRYGITEAVARDNGYQGDMKALPLAKAQAIYKNAYWDKLKLDYIGAMAPTLATELFDSGVNVGVNTAAKWLQRGLNALNDEQTIYADLTVDGSIGWGTVAALKAYIDYRKAKGILVLHALLNCQQGSYYLAIAEARPGLEDFVYGWVLNRVMSK